MVTPIANIELVNMIRRKCKIRVTEKNKNRVVFSKDEQVMILAHLTSLEQSILELADSKQLISDTVQATLQHIHNERV